MPEVLPDVVVDPAIAFTSPSKPLPTAEGFMLAMEAPKTAAAVAICKALFTLLIVAIAWLACAVACLMDASVAARLAWTANKPAEMKVFEYWMHCSCRFCN